MNCYDGWVTELVFYNRELSSSTLFFMCEGRELFIFDTTKYVQAFMDMAESLETGDEKKAESFTTLLLEATILESEFALKIQEVLTAYKVSFE